MFNKLIRKGKQMAGEYVREQLNERSSNGSQRSRGNAPSYGQQQRSGYDNQGYSDQNYGNQNYAGQQPAASGVSREDQAAIEKYKYMLRTAPPQDMERAHTEAFSRLTPQQRALLQSELSEQLPAAERPVSDQPQDLARAATRAEVSRPGFMEKILGSGSGRSRMAGGLAAGAGGLGVGLLGGVAGAFIGTAVAGPLLEGFSGIGEEFGSLTEGLGDTISGAGEQISSADSGILGDFLGDTGGDFGGFEF
ncbi:hypothetical protein [Glutamicibacter sp. M10]|uniref:hypothetical protein n=1 Tax=Glutamicibacter sp. M10 TaxID=3023076 RepID=UPI0021CA2BC0|nr:hypothetical protein [Glutamicibacter sp. M10]UXN32831.1 hypothetical protein N6V40_05135 [Glutamicibacter sp. M10]